MEDRSEEWENGSSSSSVEEEKSGKSGVGWILEKGISLGKKVVFTGIVISSAPIVLPPLVVISAIGFAVSVPFGFVYASYTCSEKLMSKLLPEAAPSLTLEDQKSFTYEDAQVEEEEDVGDASIGKRDFNAVELEEEERKRVVDEVESASFVENRNDDAKIGEEAITDDQEKQLSRNEILEEEVGDASIGKEDRDVATLEEEERRRVRDEVEKPSFDRREQVDNSLILERGVVAMEEEEKEQFGRAENEHGVKGNVLAVDEGENDQFGVVKSEPCFNGDEVARLEEEKEQGGGVQSESGVAFEGEEREQEEDMKEGIGVRIELVEDGSSRNLSDDAKVREEATKDDRQKELGRDEITEEQVYIEDEPPMTMDDIEIEELEGEKLIVVGDNFVGDGENSVQPADFVGTEVHKNIENEKEEHVSEDRNGDKNVVVEKVDDKNVELNKNVVETKEADEMEKPPPSERNEEPIRISENKDDMTLEGKNKESPENTENEGVRDDAKGDSTVRPLVFAKNEDQEITVSKKQEAMSSEDKNAKLNDDVPQTNGREKVKGGNNALGVKGREKLKGGETIAEAKQTAVEIEGRGKTENLKRQKITGNKKGTSSSNVEKTVEETKSSSEKNDLNVREDTKLESNIERIKKQSGKDESVGVRNDNKQGREMVGSSGYSVTILPDENKDSVGDLQTESKGNHKRDGAPSSDEDLLSEERVWTQIDAVRAIIGYGEQRSASMYQEVKALYLFTGVEPPSSFKESADLAELYQDLRFLMSLIGVK